MGDQVQLEEAGLGIGPLGKGADGDLVLEPGAGAGRGQPAAGEPGPERRQQARQRGGTDLAEVRVDVRGDTQVAGPGQAVEQLGEERVPAVGADVAVASESSWAAAATAGPYRRGRPERGRLVGGRTGRRSRRMAALRWRPDTATTSFSSRCFSARGARR